ncbi:sushi domain-containing protein 6-like isoform X3 [Nerophis ophidion]|uniref:sushi domain-containing protein 6-like isoform X3 n=1 Tax=Nerophis ophidion TaxID=159077 RepID=UPI002ADF105E|nr:sushi domain-containing protein 6-like isoform X3 [Nerophis ophidion]
MCNGKTEATSEACQSHTCLHLLFCLLLALAVVASGQGLGCVRPYMVENSWVNHTETNRGLFPVGTVLQYSCDPGYLPDRPSILTCISTGRWSSEPPQCTQSDACLPLSEPENGGYTCHPSPCRLFSHGTVVEFFCHTGFMLKGKYNYLTCQDGQWDGHMQISCVKRGCLRPSMEQHISSKLMDTNISSFPVGAVLQYRCDPGYQPDGPTIISCTGLGHWSSKPPLCLRTDVCQPPYQPENGGYTCHPSQCQRLSHDRDRILPLGMPALSIVSSTASSVALILFLVVLFVLLQPKLKYFHWRDQGVSGQSVSIMVEGVQVALPSYEEAVSSNTSSATALDFESRVQIVLSEGQQATTPVAGPSRPPSVKELPSEMAMVHSLPPSSSASPSSSSSWTLENASAAALQSGDQHSLNVLDSEMDSSDDMPLLKDA